MLIAGCLWSASPAGAATAPCAAGAFPATVGSVLVGRSVRGRPIVAHRVGDACAARKALVVGVIHGDEAAGLGVTRALRSTGGPPGVDLWVIDSINPDGWRRGARRNAHGVDLNRNFPTAWRSGQPPGSGYYPGPRPLSEPESRGVQRFVLRLRPAVSIWYHQPWGAVLVPCRGGAIQVRYARLSGLGFQRCRGANLPGTAIRWENATIRGSTAFVVEFPAGRISPRVIGRHARAAAAVVSG